MSRVARTVFIGSILLSGLTIFGVHFLQEWERDRMYQGVLRDEERRQEKRREREAAAQNQNPSITNRQLFDQPQEVRGTSNIPHLTRDSQGDIKKTPTPL